jgi:uncharacterized protein
MTEMTERRATERPDGAPVGSIVESVDELAELYRGPGRLVQAKKRPGLDDASVEFIARSPFVLLGTAGADGGVDVSPRGGPRGFVRVLDRDHVAVPDLNGNNLIDTLRGVVTGGRAGMLFVVPGKDETLRLNGPAWVTTADEVLDLWLDELRRPTTAIVVRADEVFVHCAKAFRRGGVWDAGSWAAADDAPSALDVLAAQGVIGPVDETVRVAMEHGYQADLAHDLPER